MATITLKNIPDELHRMLRESAGRHHRSLNSEILARLEAQFMPQKVDVEAMLGRARTLRARMPVVNHELIDEFKRQGRP